MSLTSAADNLAIMNDPTGVGTTLGAMAAKGGTYLKRNADGSIAVAGAGVITTGLAAAGNVAANSLSETGAVISASATLTVASAGYSEVDATAAEVDLTLPAVSTCTPGQEFKLVKIDGSAHAAKFLPNGTDPINGVVTTGISTTTQYAKLGVRANQALTAWYTI